MPFCVTAFKLPARTTSAGGLLLLSLRETLSESLENQTPQSCLPNLARSEFSRVVLPVVTYLSTSTETSP